MDDVDLRSVRVHPATVVASMATVENPLNTVMLIVYQAMVYVSPIQRILMLFLLLLPLLLSLPPPLQRLPLLLLLLPPLLSLPLPLQQLTPLTNIIPVVNVEETMDPVLLDSVVVCMVTVGYPLPIVVMDASHSLEYVIKKKKGKWVKKVNNK